MLLLDLDNRAALHRGVTFTIDDHSQRSGAVIDHPRVDRRSTLKPGILYSEGLTRNIVS